jgi:hypothetical protein
MPGEGDPGYAQWSAAIRREMAGLDDGAVAPPSHAGLYALAVPQAQVHRLPGRDHQLNNDLSEVAQAIRTSAPGPLTQT